jgi:hypothetical protein
MLGLVFLYYIGKAFYDLTLNHGKNNPWGFAILGIASYYLCMYAGAVILGVTIAYSSPETLESMSDTAMGIMCVPFGLLGCWGVYKLIERRWENTFEPTYNPSLLDENM